MSRFRATILIQSASCSASNGASSERGLGYSANRVTLPFDAVRRAQAPPVPWFIGTHALRQRHRTLLLTILLSIVRPLGAQSLDNRHSGQIEMLLAALLGEMDCVLKCGDIPQDSPDYQKCIDDCTKKGRTHIQ